MGRDTFQPLLDTRLGGDAVIDERNSCFLPNSVPFFNHATAILQNETHIACFGACCMFILIYNYMHRTLKFILHTIKLHLSVINIQVVDIFINCLG